tara:strand:+ start:91 stop:402 length:312 start_codon:yes stop_codon:yes gene_type:complete
MNDINYYNSIKKRKEILYLKKKYNIFNKNNFKINKIERGKYRRYILSIKKLIDLLPKLIINNHIKNFLIIILEEKKRNLLYINRLSIIYKLPNEIKYKINIFL